MSGTVNYIFKKMKENDCLLRITYVFVISITIKKYKISILFAILYE